LQKDNYFIHNIHLKGQLNSIEPDEQLPVIYVTEFFLNGILDLIKIRYLILNRLIEKLENRLGVTYTNLSDTIPTLDQEEEKLSHREIALLYYYDDLLLTDKNANEIANKYKQSSGVKLMTMYRSIKNSETERRNNKNSKKCLEKIIPKLTTSNGIDKAKKDLENAK
jgi:hypothetical protein